SDRNLLLDWILAPSSARAILSCELVVSIRDRGHPRLSQTLKPPLTHLSSERQVIARLSKREIGSQAEPSGQRLCRSFCFPRYRRGRDKQGMRRSVFWGFVDRVARPLDAFRITPSGKKGERHGK